MTSNEKLTEFVSSERSPDHEIQRQAALFAHAEGARPWLNAVLDGVLILNRQRQIIFANRAMSGLLGERMKLDAILGYRPGEALDCCHARENASGCGTTEACQVCGAFRAVLQGLQGKPLLEECRIARSGEGEGLDLLVLATPLVVDGHNYTMLAIRDVSHEKRRRALERIFFHDIMNTAVGMRGYAGMLKKTPAHQVEEVGETVYRLGHRLVAEINAQKQLAAAENNELSVELARVSSLQLLHEQATAFQHQDVAEGRTIRVDPAAEDVQLTTDKALLSRVLGNMVKNALEACQPDDAVTLNAGTADDNVLFAVHNPGVIPRDVQLQIFQRSFSTKGKGRGLGTYGMRLLSERYLQGRVWFTSSAEQGTTFQAQYPLSIDAPQSAGDE